MRLSDVHRGDLIRLVHMESGLEMVGRVIRPMDEFGNVWVRPAGADGVALCKPEEYVADADYVITQHKRASKKNEVHPVRKHRPPSRSVGH